MTHTQNDRTFGDVFISGTSGQAEHELRVVLAYGIERALSDRAFRLDPVQIAEVLAEAADLLLPKRPTPPPRQPWWTWWTR